jgi:hypothetical protein
MARYKYSPEILADAAARSASIAGVLRVLGLRLSGGSHAHISRQLKKFGVDTSHFTQQAHNRGRSSPVRKTAEQLLVQLPADARRTPGTQLKRAMQDIGIAESCARCGVGDTWRGNRLTLHVDHVNGDFLDNRPHNLRPLCPNCHSQTPTFAGRNRGVFGAIATCRFTPDPAMRNPGQISPADLAAVLIRVNDGELTATAAASLIGCAPSITSTSCARA